MAERKSLQHNVAHETIADPGAAGETKRKSLVV